MPREPCDPDVALRTLRAAINNYDGLDDKPRLKETALLAMVIGTFDALDTHLSTSGHLPVPWRDRGGV